MQPPGGHHIVIHCHYTDKYQPFINVNYGALDKSCYNGTYRWFHLKRFKPQ